MRDLIPQAIDVPLVTAVTTPIFFLLFIGLVLWIYSKHRKTLYNEVSKLPFDDDLEKESASGKR